jgi:hypothetical protein
MVSSSAPGSAGVSASGGVQHFGDPTVSEGCAHAVPIEGAPDQPWGQIAGDIEFAADAAMPGNGGRARPWPENGRISGRVRGMMTSGAPARPGAALCGRAD